MKFDYTRHFIITLNKEQKIGNNPAGKRYE